VNPVKMGKEPFEWLNDRKPRRAREETR
jgi:hypothetical protein